jgi:ATP-dependent DNA helicase RecQ
VRRAVSAASYHAGVRGAERDAVQERFMDGELDVVVATTAFGMAIDKADVRWVFHSEVSESLDAYYQEIGRAGRDGEPARAVLFYRSEDLGLRRFFAGTGHVDVDEIAQVLDAVRRAGGAPAAAALQQDLELSETKLATALSRLEEAGAVKVLPSGVIEPVTTGAAAVRAAAESEEKRRAFERSRVDMMRGYAETGECRRAFILSYFGEPFAPPCGHCDNCRSGRSEAPPEDVPFAVGSRVAHGSWGEGVVQRYDEDAVVVLFDEVGYKTLALDVIRERGLLEPA